MPLRVCHYADLLCRYDADMGLKNVSLCRYYYAVMPLEFLLGWWAHTGFLVDLPVKYAKTTVQRWYRSAKAIEG